MFYLAIGLHKRVYRNFWTKISWHGGKIAPILLLCATAPRELDLILTLCLAKLAEWTSTLAQVLLQIHKQTHILWIEILWEKTFEWVHSILVDEHTFEALDQGLWSFLSVDFAPAYQRISTWVIEGISRNCVQIKDSSHSWAHLDKVPDFGARLQCRFEFCMQTCQIMIFSRVLCAS